MKQQFITSGLTLILFSFLPCPGFAYEIQTHSEMSARALDASVLTKDPALLKNFGLQSGQSFPDSKNNLSDIKGLFRAGAEFEDNFPRPTNHFFNPYNGQALSVFGVQVGYPSPDWALEDKGQIVGGLVLGGKNFPIGTVGHIFTLR